MTIKWMLINMHFEATTQSFLLLWLCSPVFQLLYFVVIVITLRLLISKKNLSQRILYFYDDDVGNDDGDSGDC